MYFNRVRSFSTVQVKYFVTMASVGVITHLRKDFAERKSERSSLASTSTKYPFHSSFVN